MATVDVLDWNKKKVGSVDLSAAVFEAPVRKDILHTVVNWQLASRRQGTHMAQTRGMVSGTSKKHYKQKGTGTARRGSEKFSLISGGGVTFAPKNRDYSYQLPKKIRQAGLKSALSYLYAEGRLYVVDSMDSAEGKTKAAAQNLKSFGLEKSVLVSEALDEKFNRATKNLGKFRYYSVDGLNVYELLKYDNAVITKDCLDRINKRCGVES